jgi:hypothetical protein
MAQLHAFPLPEAEVQITMPKNLITAIEMLGGAYAHACRCCEGEGCVAEVFPLNAPQGVGERTQVKLGETNKG